MNENSPETKKKGMGMGFDEVFIEAQTEFKF